MKAQIAIEEGESRWSATERPLMVFCASRRVACNSLENPGTCFRVKQEVMVMMMLTWSTCT